jgi:hypothetical protein
VVEFIPEIRRLSQMSGGLDLAFDLIIFLGSNSYGEYKGAVSSDGGRSSDWPADELLVELVERMKADKPGWRPFKEVESLGKQISNLDNCGIEGYFPESFKLLSSLVNAA